MLIEFPKMQHLCQSFMPAHTQLLVVVVYCLCGSCTIFQRAPCKQFVIKMKMLFVCGVFLTDIDWLACWFTGDVSLSAVLSVC